MDTTPPQNLEETGETESGEFDFPSPDDFPNYDNVDSATVRLDKEKE